MFYRCLERKDAWKYNVWKLKITMFGCVWEMLSKFHDQQLYLYLIYRIKHENHSDKN